MIPLSTGAQFSGHETKMEKEKRPRILSGNGVGRELLIEPLGGIRRLHKGSRKDFSLYRRRWYWKNYKKNKVPFFHKLAGASLTGDYSRILRVQ